MLALALRISFETARSSARAALVRPPCRYRPLRLPVGAPPRAPWHRHPVQPRTAGARHGWRVRFEVGVIPTFVSPAATTLGLRLAGVELREQPYDYKQALAQTPSDCQGGLVVMT